MAKAQKPPAAPPAEGFERFPCVKYRKRKPSEKFPNGYETKRVYSEEEESALGKEWKDTPEGMDASTRVASSDVDE